MLGFPAVQAFPNLPNNPVTNVSWEDITATNGFLELVGARLPTEAEWEFAARGGNQRGGNNGGIDLQWSGSNSADVVAWHSGNRPSASTQPVGGRAPNELGLYDMSGNVLEWCSDWHGALGTTAVTNPTGAGTGSFRVIRGGSWFFSAAFARVGQRGNDAPTGRDVNIGFRVVFD